MSLLFMQSISHFPLRFCFSFASFIFRLLIFVFYARLLLLYTFVFGLDKQNKKLYFHITRLCVMNSQEADLDQLNVPLGLHPILLINTANQAK